jgi:Beta-lactamase
VSGIRVLFAAACLVFVPEAIHAQVSAPTPRPAFTAVQTDAIDQLVKSEMTRQRVPGLEVGVYSRGRLLLAKGYGLADVELNVPVTSETVMQSGSVGKQFVSAAIMMLAEENKLSLDDSITRYFPDAPATWKPMLIKNLLSHTSGLSEYESGGRVGPNGPFYLRLDFTEDELIKKIYALPIEWAPCRELRRKRAHGKFITTSALAPIAGGNWAAQFCDNNRFIRQELLDQIVWAEVVRLLQDPVLIQQELDRRLAAARASDPTRKREQIIFGGAESTPPADNTQQMESAVRMTQQFRRQLKIQIQRIQAQAR